MKRIATLLLCTLALPVLGQAGPKIFIDAGPNFSGAIAAAMVKKHVAAQVVTDKDRAEYVLQAGPVNAKEESGAGKVARCLFLDCIGINGNSTASVQLIRNADGVVVWAYQVRKGDGGPRGTQSLSEAIAKHLENDFLKKQK